MLTYSQAGRKGEIIQKPEPIRALDGKKQLLYGNQKIQIHAYIQSRIRNFPDGSGCTSVLTIM